MVCGFPWHECGDRTTSSDSTGSMCALVYATTPSLPCSGGPVPSTEMIECGGMDGATGIVCKPRMNGWPGDMLSTAVGTNGVRRGVEVPAELGREARDLERHDRQPPDEIGDDPVSRDEAPAVGRRDEHDARHLGKRLDEHPAPDELARLVGEMKLVEGLPADGVPQAIAGADGLHLDQQAALAVPDEHHSAECRVLALRIHPRHRGGDRVAQAERGERDRIARVVLEEPELIAAADLGIALQPVVHLGPPHEARSRAVHEDDRDEPRPIRRRGHERRPLGQRTGQPAEEAQRLELEDRHARERERQGGRRLALERHALARDRDGALVPRQVELERRRERLPADEGAAGVLDVQQGGERYPQARRDDVAAGRGVLGGRRRRRERRAEARPAIAERESLHFELGDRDEPVQHAIARAQLGRIERDGDLAERQRERAAGRDDLLAVLRLEGGRQGPVVQVGGEAKARIERRGSRGAVFRKQERPRVDHRGQLVLAPSRLLAVERRQLGEREEHVGIAPGGDHGPVERGDRRLRPLGEHVEEPALEQDVTRRPARLSGRDGAPREIAMGDGAIDPDRAHRRAARARREAEHAEEQ